MSLNYFIRVANMGSLDAENRDRPSQSTVDSVEIPGSHILWRLMEGAGYKVSGPDGDSCGEVADWKETTRGMSLRRHEALFTLFAKIRDEGRCPNTGIPVQDESAMYRVTAMVDALHLVVQMQKAMIAANVPVMVTIAWS